MRNLFLRYGGLFPFAPAFVAAEALCFSIPLLPDVPGGLSHELGNLLGLQQLNGGVVEILLVVFFQ